MKYNIYMMLVEKFKPISLKGFFMKTNKIVLSLLTIAILSSSTGYARYKSMPLIKDSRLGEVSTEESISFESKAFTAKDCKTFFNSKSILKKGYQPVQITVKNNSQSAISISPADLSFSCVAPQEVADTLHRSSKARGLGLGIPGLVFGWALIIPAFVQGLGAHDFNDDMDADFANKALQPQVIAPGKTVSGVVFTTRESFSPDFTLTVKNESTKEALVLSPKKAKTLHFEVVKTDK